MSEKDAIELLVDDHEKVKALFEEFEALSGSDDESMLEDKSVLVQQICQELIVHTALEEEIFYPAAREALADDELIDEAIVEHASAKELIEQLQEMQPDEEMYDAKVKVLKEQIEHHVKEEEDSLFPQVRGTELDLEHYGSQMAERRDELLAMPDLTAISPNAPTQPRQSR